tara:strand:+ start:2058 stop:3383 length:1326 start_codon:yes stop_codon:yes gene_type:complete
MINLNPDFGQVLTPDTVAEMMIKRSLSYLKNKKLSILDPAIGPATFLKAINKLKLNIKNFDGYDIDNRMCIISNEYCSKLKYKNKIFNEDFLLNNNQTFYDFVILNPPYIRQEKLSTEYKKKLKEVLKLRNIKVNGRSNLFIYFLFKCLSKLEKNGILCAIIYDSILNTKYGKEFWDYLSNNFKILEKKSISTPFNKTIIDATIIIVSNQSSSKKFSIENNSKNVRNNYVKLSELLKIQRGITLSSRKVFLSHKNDGDIYKKSLPIIMKPKIKDKLNIEYPDQRFYNFGQDKDVDSFLINKAKSIDIDIKIKPVKLIFGKIIFNYYIRNSPKHYFNSKNLNTSDNFYVSTVKDSFPEIIAFLLLNTELFVNSFLDSSRNQGNGLRKLQVYEYKNTFVPDWRTLSKSELSSLNKCAYSLLIGNKNINQIQFLVNDLLIKSFL